MGSRILFITGTDTGVGKTVLTSLLARHLRERGVAVAALKPIYGKNVYDRFVSANPFVSRRFPNFNPSCHRDAYDEIRHSGPKRLFEMIDPSLRLGVARGEAFFCQLGGDMRLGAPQQILIARRLAFLIEKIAHPIVPKANHG